MLGLAGGCRPVGWPMRPGTPSGASDSVPAGRKLDRPRPRHHRRRRSEPEAVSDVCPGWPHRGTDRGLRTLRLRHRRCIVAPARPRHRHAPSPAGRGYPGSRGGRVSCRTVGRRRNVHRMPPARSCSMAGRARWCVESGIRCRAAFGPHAGRYAAAASVTDPAVPDGRSQVAPGVARWSDHAPECVRMSRPPPARPCPVPGHGWHSVWCVGRTSCRSTRVRHRHAVSDDGPRGTRRCVVAEPCAGAWRGRSLCRAACAGGHRPCPMADPGRHPVSRAPVSCGGRVLRRSVCGC